MTRAAIYVRISDDHGDDEESDDPRDRYRPRGLGVARQEVECRELAETLGWTVGRVYSDPDISAYGSKRRPGFEEMLSALDRGEFDAVICWHVDRLYRNMRDLERVITIMESRRIELRTVAAGGLDLSTPAGRQMARILGAVARAEVETKGARQRSANRQARAAGQWNRAGVRRFGYTKDGEPQEPEATLVKTAATDVLAGKSLRSISREWNTAGWRTTEGNPWTTLQLRRMLLNPLYAGLMTYQGNVVGEGTWTPLLDKDIHNGLVAFLTDPARRPVVSFEKRHMLSAVARCGVCGGKMAAMRPTGSKSQPKRGVTYVCRGVNDGRQHVGRIGDPLDRYVEAIVLQWFSQPDTRERLSALLHGTETVDVQALQAQHEALQARKRQLGVSFAKGAIDADVLESGTRELSDQQAEINRVLGDLVRNGGPAGAMLSADDPRAHWESCSVDLRGKIINEVMTVTVLPSTRRGRWFADKDNPTESEWEQFGALIDIQPR